MFPLSYALNSSKREILRHLACNYGWFFWPFKGDWHLSGPFLFALLFVLRQCPSYIKNAWNIPCDSTYFPFLCASAALESHVSRLIDSRKATEQRCIKREGKIQSCSAISWFLLFNFLPLCALRCERQDVQQGYNQWHQGRRLVGKKLSTHVARSRNLKEI